MRDMSEFEPAYVKKGVRMLAVNVLEPRADGQKFIDGAAIHMPWYFADDAAAAALGVKAVPTQILLDREGKVIWKSSLGSVADGAPAILAAIDDALAAAPK